MKIFFLSTLFLIATFSCNPKAEAEAEAEAGGKTKLQAQTQPCLKEGKIKKSKSLEEKQSGQKEASKINGVDKKNLKQVSRPVQTRNWPWENHNLNVIGQQKVQTHQAEYGKNKKESSKVMKQLLARITCYWARGKGADHLSKLHKGCLGVKLAKGACAVDPKKIPFKSKIAVLGMTVTALDTGTDVKNRKAARLSGRTTEEKLAPVIDLFFETKKEADDYDKNHPPFQRVALLK